MFANLFSNFEKKNMQDLWLNDNFWRILVNSIGVISIVVGAWLLYKLLKAYFINNKAKRKMDERFINIKNLPDIFSEVTQISLTINFNQHVRVSLLDEKENSILTFHDDELMIGEKIFHLDTNNYNNGDYFISVKTDFQNIFRKIKVQN